MTTANIDDLSAAAALDGSELVEVMQGGVNVQTTTQDIADLGGGGGLSETHGTWTPTVTAGSGTFTSVAATGRYTTIGSWVFFDLDVTITTNGSAASAVIVTMPFTARAGGAFTFSGREDNVTGAQLQARFYGGTAAMAIWQYDNTYPGGDGRIVRMSGVYRKA